MKLTCSKDDLQKALNAVARAAAAKLQKTILDCTLFSCQDDTLTLKATNLTLSVKTQIPADIAADGTAAIPTHLLLSLITKFTEPEVELEKIDDKRIKVSCGDSVTTIMIMDEDEFPTFPSIDEQEAIRLSKKRLKSMIEQTVFSIALEEDRPIFTGVLFDIEEDSFTTVGVDGYRMAVRTERTPAREKMSCVIPGRALRETVRIMDDDGDVSITIGDNMALFDWDGAKVYTRLLDGEYINYRNLIPDSFSVEMLVSVRLFHEALERCSVLAREGDNNIVKLEIKEKGVTVSSKTNSGDGITEEMPAETHGANLTIAFNAKYIIDILKNIDEEEIELKMSSPLSPCIMRRDRGESSYTFMVMPVQIHKNSN